MADSVRVLAVDDNPEALFALKELLTQKGFSVVTASTGEDALKLLESDLPDIILLDVSMPGISGLEVTRIIKSDPEKRLIPLVLLTANSDLDDLTQGLDAGADNYIVKPYRPDELIARIHAMVRTRGVYAELRATLSDNSRLREMVKERSQFSQIVGNAASMKEIFTLIEKVKDSHVAVLITGESGTGKELVARAIHFNSPRKNKPFIAQNCSAFNENLLESELFGHVKGAFTGAVKDKQGLFEAADGGTFFLDELGEMSLALQVKLLRVLQDGTFTPVGATGSKKVQVRIIAATNRNLKEMISRGTFREDLYYRLNVINIQLPPLRERRDDISHLADHFLKTGCYRAGRDSKALSADALRLLSNYEWPGNIRELENEVERIILMSGDESVVSPAHLSSHIRGAAASPQKRMEGKLKDALESLERDMITQALERTGGNKSKAAEELGVSRTNLIKKAQSFGLE